VNLNDEADDASPDRRASAERARFHLTLGVLRAALEEQPTSALVRSTGRRWINAAAQLISEVAKNTEGRK
jgi:hypothetical protein